MTKIKISSKKMLPKTFRLVRKNSILMILNLFLFILLASAIASVNNPVYGYEVPSPTPTPPSCEPVGWNCRNGDVPVPPVSCATDTGDAIKCYPKGTPLPINCPTNQDSGQDDGTGQTGVNRTYNTYDYDTQKTVSVPPIFYPNNLSLTPTPVAYQPQDNTALAINQNRVLGASRKMDLFSILESFFAKFFN